jgi:anaerobic selenocysteine-containing dehydrogenase
MFHGDLVERAMALLLALTGNWGKEGTGMRSWGVIYEPIALSGMVTADPFLKEIVAARADRELTDEEVEGYALNLMFKMYSIIIPAVFFWYRCTGYGKLWDSLSLEDAGIPKKIGEYIREAVEKGWWKYVDLPEEGVQPKILFSVASNTLRNKPGTTMALLEELWPKLDLVVCIDYRWSTTAMHADIVLPGAFHHEKEQFHTLCNPEIRFWAYAEKAIDPVYDSKWEAEIPLGIARKIAEKARERGLKTYRVPHGITLEKLNDILKLEETGFGELEELPEVLDRLLGVERRYEDLPDRLMEVLDYLYRAPIKEEGIYSLRLEKRIEEISDKTFENISRSVIDLCVKDGVFEEGTTYEKIKNEGFVKYAGLGKSVYGLNQAADVKPDRVVVALEKHVKDKKPFPTLTGRAQFYIDHEWFLEAGEELPCYKKPPAVLGGDRSKYPYYLTSGHNRYSTHGITLTNELQLNLHRGEPHVFISKKAAEKKGIKDGDYIRVFNDFGEVIVQAKVSSLVKEDQIIFYHGWDSYLFPNAGSLKTDLSPGLIKPLLLAGGYGQFYYRLANWQPQFIYRHVCVDFEPVKLDELEKFELRGDNS